MRVLEAFDYSELSKGLSKVFIGILKHYKFSSQYAVLIFQTLKRFSLLTLGYKINKFSLMSVSFVLKAPIQKSKKSVTVFI